MKIRSLLLLVAFGSITMMLRAQSIPVHPTETGGGVFLGETRALRDIPEISSEEMKLLQERFEAKQLNKKLRYREYPYADIALPKGPDAAWQRSNGTAKTAKTPTMNFDGQNSSSWPPDCNGTAGQNHYMQTVNVTYAIYDKATGTKVAGPTAMNQLFSGVPGANCNDGDPIVLYDEQADRWLATEFSLCGSNDLMLMAVSTTNDPTGTWYAYSFDVAGMPDYPKFSVWQDGYYMGDNNSSSNDIYVFDRATMLSGGTNPQFMGFNNSWRPGSVDGFMCVPPVDNDGAFAPAGSPGLFIAMVDDAFNSSPDQLWIYELAVNWSNTAASTFNRVQQLNVVPFDSNFGNNWTNIKQPGTSQELDAVPQVIMNVPQYRNFGSYQTIVCCHTVDVDGTDHAGIRWYELRKTPPSTQWVVRQSGTYAPDANSRWMGSVMLNGNNEIGLGYSISSSTVYPGIRYCGQTAGEYANASGVLDYPEDVIMEGAYSQTAVERWGDYALLSVDPANDATFWFTTEYKASSTLKTKIASFQIGPVLPSADFTANTVIPCKDNTTVNFTSQTTGNPTLFAWEFTPNTVTYDAGTSSSSPNPKVIFNAYGEYTVSLTVTNDAGSKTVSKANYIHVNEANANFTASATTVFMGNSTVFTDASTCGATSWAWSFGDGASPATANTKGPHVVTYNTAGLKTVILTVNNGVSTETKTDYINVTGPTINMTTTTIAACNGNFYDSGGAGANYGNNEDYSMCLKPGIPGSKAQVTFTSFNVETQSSCNKDYLRIHDGTNAFAPVIGTYCGTTSPGTITASNADGALYFVFHSNATVNMAGWAADIACTAIPTANPASFNAQASSASQIDLDWLQNPDNNDVMIAWSTDGVFGVPENGATYTPGMQMAGGGTVLYTGSATSFSHTGLPSATTYYYKAFAYNASHVFSMGLEASATTFLQPTLSVDPQNLNVPAPAGSSTISITSNTAWTASSDQSWCTVVASGTGTVQLSADYQENLSVNPRVAHITITVNGLAPIVVTLTQAGAAPILLVSPPNQNVGDPAGNTAFTVTSNTDWAVSSNQSWCTITPSGSGNGTITAAFTQNPTVHERIANISVNVNGIPTVIVTVTQAAAAPMLAVTPPVINVNAYAASVDYTVTSNTDWTASADSAWCVVTGSGSGNGTITAVYPWNPSGKDRSTKISISAAGVTTQVVTLMQGHETASVPENGSKGVSIYPNPAKGIFSIVVEKSKYPSMQVNITDAHGTLVTSRECKGESEYKFDLSSSPQGTYFVKISTGTEQMVTKLVIIR
jgi:PKD repeat protein